MTSISLDELINLDLLEIFGRATIVPLVGTISSLSLSLQALSDEVEALEPESMDGTFGQRLDKCEQNILALVLAVTVEAEAEVSGTADNIVVEVFDSTSGYILMNGAYDSVNHRLYA